MIKLASPAAGGPYKIILIAKNTIIVDNILSGEVWFASGPELPNLSYLNRGF